MYNIKSYVAKGDPITAIHKEIDPYRLRFHGFEIESLEQIAGGIGYPRLTIARTTHGDFFCETFQDDLGDIYTRVSRYI